MPSVSYAAAPPAPAPAAPARQEAAKKKGGFLGGLFKDKAAAPEPQEEILLGAAMDDEFADGLAPLSPASDDMDDEFMEQEKMASVHEAAAASLATDGGVGLLEKQLASGLWAGTGTGSEPERQARATALALLELLRQGITSNHALHGAQVKKAVEALLALMPQLSGAPDVAELALGVAWLVAAGPRTRGRIAQAAQPLNGLSSRLENEVALRQHVDALAGR
jgi:Ca-activated chloride channel family protein